MIVKMDATLNDAPPQFEVKGFPTLFWIPAKDKLKPKIYSGAREFDSLLEFVKKNKSFKPAGWNEEEDGAWVAEEKTEL